MLNEIDCKICIAYRSLHNGASIQRRHLMDPYNNNPFKTDTARDARSEYAANRQLKETK